MRRKAVLIIATFAIVMAVCSIDRAFAQFGPPTPKTTPDEKIDPVLEQKNIAILAAAKRGEWQTVKQMLRDNPELIAARTRRQMQGHDPMMGQVSLLHMAAKEGNNKMATFLLSRGAEINVEDDTGWTPIFYAAFTGESGMVKYLLGRGADIENKKNVSLVLVAVQSGDDKTVHLLRHAGASAGSPLLDAIVDEDAGTLRRLLAEDPSCLGAYVPYLHKRPLHWAVLVGNADIVGIMLDYDADIMAGQMASPCLLAIQNGNLEITAMLLEADASVLASPDCAKIAVESGDVEMVKLLIEHGCDVVKTRPGGVSLLAHCGNAEVAALLLDKGLDVNERTRDGQTALHAAAHRGDKELVLFLLERGAKLQVSDGNQTPLHAAANGGHLEIVRILLAKGADINAADKNKITPILSALYNGQTDIAKFLIEKGADVTVQDKDGCGLLYYAAGSDDTELVQMLIDKGADVNARGRTTPMMGQSAAYGYPVERAAIAGNAEILELLIRNGADLAKANPFMAALDNHRSEIVVLLIEKYPDAIRLDNASKNIYEITADKAPDVFIMLIERAADVNEADKLGRTPMHFAAATGNNKAIEILIKRGADVNARSTERSGGGVMGTGSAYNLPIEKAADRGKDATVNLLLENGAQPGATLHIYIEKNKIEMCEYLLANGADVNDKDSRGYTPLHMAVDKNNVQIILVLIDKGADVNAQNNEGDTPLHVAIMRNNAAMVDSLIEKGADVNTKNNKGQTPLYCAINRKNIAIINNLIEKGADLKTVCEDGSTLLHWAVEKRDKKLINMFIERGLDVNARKNNGDTVLMCALSSKCDLDIIKLLIEKGADVKAANNVGETPLHFAAKHSKPEICRHIIDKGGDPKAVDKDGVTPLHIAATAASKDTIALLLENGADPCARDKDGKTPRDYAIKRMEDFKQIDPRNRDGLQTKFAEIAKFLEKAEKEQQAKKDAEPENTEPDDGPDNEPDIPSPE